MLYKVADILCKLIVILFNMLFKVFHTTFYGRASLVNLSFDRF